MDRKILLLLKLLVSVSILSYLIFKVGPLNIYNSLKEIKIFAFTSVLFLITLNGVSSFNLKLLLIPFRKIEFFSMFKYVFVGWSLGIFTPGKVGEFTTAYWISKKEKISLGKATSLLLLDKLITFFFMAIFALVGFYIFLTKNTFWLALILVLLIFISIVLFFSTRFIKNFLKKSILKKYLKKLSGFSTTFNYMFKKEKSLVSMNIIITFFKFLVSAYMTKVIFLALGENIPIVFIILINAAVAISTLIPISINGLGITEGLYVFLFSNLGMDVATVMAHNIFLIATNYSIALLTVLLFFPKSSQQ